MEEAEEEAEVVEGCVVGHVADYEVGHGFCSSAVECTHVLEREGVVYNGSGGVCEVSVWGVWRVGECGECKEEECCEEEKCAD